MGPISVAKQRGRRLIDHQPPQTQVKTLPSDPDNASSLSPTFPLRDPGGDSCKMVLRPTAPPVRRLFFPIFSRRCCTVAILLLANSSRHKEGMYFRFIRSCFVRIRVAAAQLLTSLCTFRVDRLKILKIQPLEKKIRSLE